MMRFLFALFLLAGPLAAHPHSKVEQQAILSIGLNRAVLSIRIVPSYDEGAAIFAHLDQDEDGEVSETEAMLFGDALIAKTEFVVDGTEVAFGYLSVKVPDAKIVATGEGMIEVRAEARFPELKSAEPVIRFLIGYEDLSHHWFTQPFNFGDLADAFPHQSIERSEDGTRLMVKLSRK